MTSNEVPLSKRTSDSDLTEDHAAYRGSKVIQLPLGGRSGNAVHTPSTSCHSMQLLVVSMSLCLTERGDDRGDAGRQYLETPWRPRIDHQPHSRL